MTDHTIIENVCQFFLTKEHIIITKNNNTVTINNKTVSHETNIAQLIDDCYVLFFNKNLDKQYVIDLKNKREYKIDSKINISNNKINSNVFLAQNFSEDFTESEIVFFNIKENKITKKCGIYNIDLEFFFDNMILINRKTKLELINTEGDTIWLIDLSLFDTPKYGEKLNQIKKIIGIHNDTLLLTTKGGRLITVSIKTGNIVHKFSTQESDLNFGYETTIKGTSFFVNNNDNNLYCMSANYFQKINTQTYEIEESFNFREVDFSGMGTYKNIYSPLLQGNYFTFLGEKSYGDGVRYIGLYDYNSKKLIWEYELISKEDFMNGNKLTSPELVYFSNEKLFVKDFKNNLHIFEELRIVKKNS